MPGAPNASLSPCCCIAQVLLGTSAGERIGRKSSHIAIDSEQASRKWCCFQLFRRHSFTRTGYVKGFQIWATESAIRCTGHGQLYDSLQLALRIVSMNLSQADHVAPHKAVRI